MNVKTLEHDQENESTSIPVRLPQGLINENNSQDCTRSHDHGGVAGTAVGLRHRDSLSSFKKAVLDSQVSVIVLEETTYDLTLPY